MIGVGGLQIISVRSIVDSDAGAYLAALTNPDAVIRNAIAFLVNEFKANGLWSISTAIYPMPGGAASNFIFNLKNPANSNAAFRLNMNGAWDYNSVGMKGNGVDTFADTFWVPSARLASINTGHFSIFVTENFGTEVAREIGCQNSVSQSFWASLNNGSGSGAFMFRENSSEGCSGATLSIGSNVGYYIASRISSTSIFRNFNKSIVNGGVTASSGARPNVPAYIGAHNSAGTASGFSNKRFGFATFGSGLTTAQSDTQQDIVAEYNRMLYRY